MPNSNFIRFRVLKEIDIHTAGDLLKGLLGALPEPIVTDEIFSHLRNAERLRRDPPPIKYGDKRIDQIYMDYVKGALKQLPTANKDLLFYLLAFFNIVSDTESCVVMFNLCFKLIDNQKVTKMDARNIATIFSSIIFGMPTTLDSALFLKENDIRSIMLEYFIQLEATIKVSMKRNSRNLSHVSCRNAMDLDYKPWK